MGGFQSRPRGAKASKRDKSEDIRAPRMLKAVTDALHALAQATAERKTVALFNTAMMRDTPKAVASLSSCACSQPDGEARVRSIPTRYSYSLAETVAVSALPPAVSPATTTLTAATSLAASDGPPAAGRNVPGAGETTPSTLVLTSTSTPCVPLAQEPAAGSAVAPASTPEAVALNVRRRRVSTSRLPLLCLHLRQPSPAQVQPVVAGGCCRPSRPRLGWLLPPRPRHSPIGTTAFKSGLCFPLLTQARTRPVTKNMLRGATLVKNTEAARTCSMVIVY